jgi:adhesin transport system membrane fusion protein
LAALVASYVIRVPEVVAAPGTIRPAQELVPVDAERTGRVATLSVREGDTVAAGAILLTFDDADVRRPLEIERERLKRLQEQRAELERLLAMLRGGPQETLTLYAERYGNIRSELKQAEHRADAAERESKRYEELRVAKTEAELQDKRDAARDARLEFDRLRTEQLAGVEAQLRAAEQELPAVRVSVENLELELNRSRIVAPVAGRIAKSELREAGGVVQRGQRLFTVAPEGSGWILESYVPSGARGVVQPGMEARIHLAPYPATDFGTISGRVEWVSPDSAGDGAARRVRVRLLGERVEGREGTGVAALGMAAEARIVTRERRLLFHLTGTLEEALELQD